MSSLIPQLRKFAEGHPKVGLGYLFGSKARKTTHAQSDIDVAFLLAGEPTLDDRIDLISQLMKTLQTNDVDVVILNQASPLLRYEVVTDGILFFQRDEETANAFEMKTYREYFDTEHLRKVQNDILKEEILRVDS